MRKWYSHDPVKFGEFARRYRAELDDPERAEALQHLRKLATGHRLTLLTATKNPDISQAAVLCDLLRLSDVGDVSAADGSLKEQADQ